MHTKVRYQKHVAEGALQNQVSQKKMFVIVSPKLQLTKSEIRLNNRASFYLSHTYVPAVDWSSCASGVNLFI